MSILKSLMSMTGNSKSINFSTTVYDGLSTSLAQTSNCVAFTWDPALPGAPIIVDKNGNIVALYKKKF
ncbi:hypothetical protein DDB_G0281997 [Dictyostelium discoideum AX4]|uniref:Uncharacterized protein n=1 Tax=Dictyostelium discoideum TaxID=44689 RepID=Q54T53_DICDI|nr:hypothetical protein DDB_G0281997 [Dictyostelium discoideum AX4]EAL66420.1 hypothetical protein DDB_G0281997 [Dictyostelium discoideum AX4]|eukprot:XP_640398.1 hypothetical protein DDB_G0281997 [Dictyostelium discoideum AX4]